MKVERITRRPFVPQLIIFICEGTISRETWKEETSSISYKKNNNTKEKPEVLQTENNLRLIFVL